MHNEGSFVENTFLVKEEVDNYFLLDGDEYFTVKNISFIGPFMALEFWSFWAET